MFIVLFHVLYLFGKLIYTRYKCQKHTEKTETFVIGCNQADMGLPLRGRNSEIGKLGQPPGEEGDEDDTDLIVMFFPPAYIQRYVAVRSVFVDDRYRGKLRKVVDFGCAELEFIVQLKNTPGVEEILCVDVNRELLEIHQHKASPLHVDYLHIRDTPLTIRIIEGSVTQNDKMLEKTDAVICIELIEHLYPDTLTDLPYNIFGYIKPQVVIITTPNFEFNVLFNNSGFRHYDHKFEWTRQQFQDWAENIVLRFPEYEVSFSGICKGPAGTEDLGCCSQMAVFHRTLIPNKYVFPGIEGLFKVIATHEYPFHIDNRSDEQKILDDAIYFIRSYSMYSLEKSEEVPLASLLDPLKKYYVTIESLKELLEQNGWTVVDREKGPVVLVPESSVSDSNSDRESWNDLNLSWNEQDNPEDDWDFDPGPPSHYNSDQLAEIAIIRENWGDEPFIPSTQIQQELTEQEIVSSDSARLEDSEDNNIKSTEEANRSHEFISDVNLDESIEIIDETEFRNSSNASSYLDLPTNAKSHSSTLKSSSPLTFSFKGVLSETTELPCQKLTQIEFESQLSNDRLMDNSIENSPRRKYRQVKKKAQVSPKNLLDELRSLCSIYLESSRNENSKTCFEGLSNCSFESTISATSSVNDSKVDENLVFNNINRISAKKPRVDESLNSSSNSALNTLDQFFSSSQTSAELKRKVKRKEYLMNEEESLTEAKLWEGLETPESLSSENLLQSNSQISLLSFSNASMSTPSIEKLYPVEMNLSAKSTTVALESKSKVTNEINDEIASDSDPAVSYEIVGDEGGINSAHVNNKIISDKLKSSQEPTKIIEGIGTNENVISKKICASDPSELKSIQIKELTLKSDNSFDDPEILKDEFEAERMIAKRHANFVFKDSYVSKALDLSDVIEVRTISSEVLDTPPNSWSPEVMDSGYPNSASAHDITPECDLPSIAHDRISDSESPSIEEAPRLGFLELVEVENGDLANNNRDDEGNNMIAVEDNDDEDLQPLINVLEDDMENENDIYVLQNGFPAWLLRILQMQEIDVAGRMPLFGPLLEVADEEAAIAEFDEGFSSSSEEEIEEDDESGASENIENVNVEQLKNEKNDNP